LIPIPTLKLQDPKTIIQLSEITEMPTKSWYSTVHYTARNATDLLQVADFTGLLQVVNKLQQAC
jgi:hypothetical protein